MRYTATTSPSAIGKAQAKPLPGSSAPSASTPMAREELNVDRPIADGEGWLKEAAA